MKSTVRLYLGSALFIALASFLIGFVTIQSWQSSEYQRIDRELQTSIALITEEPGDKLQAAIYAASQSELPITVVFVGMDGSLNQLVDSKASFPISPTQSQLDSATTKAITLFDQAPVRTRAVALADNEYLLLGTSIEDLVTAKNTNIRFLLISVIIVVIIGSIIQTFVIRRNLKISQLKHAVDIERSFNRKMQTFIGDASHELRTPLTVIKGYVELLATSKKDKSDSEEKAFSRLDSEIKRMEALIKDLLLITELNDTTEIIVEPMNFSTMVKQSVEDLHVLQPNRPVEINVNDGVIIDGDMSLIAQLLSNIFSNIARHTKTETRVMVNLKLDQDRAVFVVEDAGSGLPKHFYTEGIQHFQRYDKSRSRASGGSGLGMSIMAAIVERHGGSIDLSASMLGGLCITVKLPAHSLS